MTYESPATVSILPSVQSAGSADQDTARSASAVAGSRVEALRSSGTLIFFEWHAQILIPLQQPRNARDRAGELPRVSFADPLHAGLPYRLILKIDESEPLSVGVQHNVRLVVLLDPPRRRVSAAGSHALWAHNENKYSSP
jgi:hypothetical protein